MNIFGLEIRRAKQEETPTPATFTGYSDALLFNRYTGSSVAQSCSAYFRGVDLISDSLGILPISVVFENGEACSHPLNSLLKRKYGLIKLLVESALNRGNGYCHIQRDNSGNVTGLRFLDPGDVIVEYNKERNELWYKCSLLGKGRIESCNMIHIRKHTRDGINGISVINYASRTLGISNATENCARDFFQNGMNLQGILTVQGQLSDQQREQIRSSWNQAYTGGSNGLAILPGNMQFSAIQLNTEDAQLLQSRAFNIQEISRFLGLSPLLLGDYSGGNVYNGLEQSQTQFLLNCLLPWVIIIENELTEKLLKPSEKETLKISLDENVLLRVDKATQAQYYGSLVDKGIISRNEARVNLGFEEKEGLDKIIVAYSDVNQNTLTKTGDYNEEEKQNKTK